ncbi:unnamed protein product [Urochloa decumbens]|uniref:KIB1-4 beta-propeller domain-containing protein n=1 Tax=Urochloa decumbens TaxID=240449 RepID=A0ABC9FFT3_9POAL
MEEVVETQEPALPPLDPTLAPVLMFYCGRGGADPEEEGDVGSARLVYSIPKRQLLLAGEVDLLFDDVNWITPQGWMLTLDPATRSTSLRDPFTSRAIALPPDTGGLLAGSDETTCVISTPTPADPSCVVLVIHLTNPVLCYCRPGGTRWLRHEYRPELLVTDDHLDRDKIIHAVANHTTGASGRFHTCWSDKVATLEFSPAAPEPTVLSATGIVNMTTPPACFCLERTLVESCGELFGVVFWGTALDGNNFEVLRVLVEKLEWSSGAWVKVGDLGSNRVFFISEDQFGASLPADEFGFKENCIYFCNNYDKGLYVYDMEQGTTAMHNPGIEIPDSLGPILLMPAA